MKKLCSKGSLFFASVLLVGICLTALLIPPLHAAPLKFAVISDSHIHKNNSGMILDAIIKEILTINASSATPIKLLVVTGDMVFNHQRLSPQTPESYREHLDNFFSIIGRALKKTNIKILILRGNHDNHYTDHGDHGPYDASYGAVLEKNKHLLAVPHDKDKPNFHYAVDNVSFIMLNMIALTQDGKSEATADIAWLNKIKKDTQAHTFVFGHYPAFSAHKATYAMHNTAALLDCMAANGYQYYFSGHDHIFTHAILEKKDTQGKVIAVVNQVGCPNSAGGRLSRAYKGKLYGSNADDWSARLKNSAATFKDKKPGFIIVEVVDDKVGVTAYKMSFNAVYNTQPK